MKKLGVLLFLAVLLCASASAQQPAKKLNLVKVSGQVYQLTGSGGNIGVFAGNEGVLLVDTGTAPVLPEIKQALTEFSGKTIRYAVITHYHHDHVASNAQLSTEVPIIAHENVRKRMSARKDIATLNSSRPPDPAAALPTITFKDELTLYLNREEVKLIHFPNAHTDGDVMVYFPQSNVVHMGDTLFANLYPFVDVDNGGNVLGLAAAVDKLLATVPGDTRFIAGHGPVYTAEQLRAYSGFLKDCVQIVETAMKQGKSLDQMKSEKILAKYDNLNGFIKTPQFTEFVYKSIKR